MGVLMHGDAAFAGQGVVYETFLLARLREYGTGGTVHVIVNNQVGFTTDPDSARSTLHCSDLGKAFDVPIFHVCADDPEAVTRVFELAAEYRQHFASDVIIDLVGYRRHGHNELDQPAYTQPLMYARIAGHRSALDAYQAALAGEGEAATAAPALAAVRAKVESDFAAAWDAAKAPAPPPARGGAPGPARAGEAPVWLASNWAGLLSPETRSRIKPTGVEEGRLRALGAALTRLPPGFAVHASLARILKAKEEMFASGAGFDWATAEALAFASQLSEKNRVRLSGQDVERGTFSHRHAVLHDQRTNATHCPLAQLGAEAGAHFVAANSPLSEFGVMGFELGYAMEAPNQLVLWEGQFVRAGGAKRRCARSASAAPPPPSNHWRLPRPPPSLSFHRATLSMARRSSSKLKIQLSQSKRA